MPTSVEVTTPSDREIVVSRTFASSKQRLFDYHTQPALVRQWMLGPPGWSMPVCDIDLRVGGRYTYRWRADDGSHEFGTHGEFLEIAAPSRIVHTENMDGYGGEALGTLTFVERDGHTTLLTVMRFADRATRDAALQSGMTDGMGMSYDRLESVMPSGA